MGEDSAVPFDVVNEARFVSLLGQDLIEWFEPDGEAVLIDPFPAETETAAFLQGALSPWYADEMWHLDMIGAETAYTLDAVGEGVRVAVIDSGVNPHPDLAGCLAEGWNYININQSASTGDANGHGSRRHDRRQRRKRHGWDFAEGYSHPLEML